MADTQYTINCPACGKEMKKIFVEDAGISVDVCLDGCGGILFNNRELEKFDEAHEKADEIFESINGKEFETIDTSKLRICPVCNAKMVKNGAANGEVRIDVCNVCGAKFLDNGELEKIIAYEQKELTLDSKQQIIYDELEASTTREALGGGLGEFINNNFKASNGRQATESAIKIFFDTIEKHKK